MRSFQVPGVIAPATRARSKTLGIETLEATTVPPGLISDRSTSLCACDALSGHQRAPSKVLGDVPLIDSGISIVPPLPIDTLPHQAQPLTGSWIGPAPVVLLKG